MPKEGYKTITVRREVYERLRGLAERTDRSVPKLIEHLIRTEKVSEEPSQSAAPHEDLTPNIKEGVEG